MASSPVTIFALLVFTLVITVISFKLEMETNQKNEATARFATTMAKKFFVNNQTIRPAFTLTAFQWANCSGSGNGIDVQSLQVNPDPLVIPGYMYAGTQVNLKQTLTKMPLFIKAYKKVFGVYVLLPCENGMGSCSYSDFCNQWPYPSPCPSVYVQNGIPCSCPINAGDYHLPLSKLLYLDKGQAPSWLENGDYRVNVIVKNADSSQTLACVNMWMSVKAN